jgi:hypothetical protein
VQIAGDAVAVLVHREPFPVPLCLRHHQRERGLRGEPRGEGAFRLRERALPTGAWRDEAPQEASAAAQREQHDRAPFAQEIGGQAPVGGRVVDEDVLAAEECGDDRAVRRHYRSEGLHGPVRGDGHDLQAALVGRQQHDPGGRPGEPAGVLGNDLEGVFEVAAGEQRGRDGDRTVDPAFPLLGRLAQPGVADGDAGLRGENPDRVEVLLVERSPATLLGQVQLPVDLLPEPDRDAEEGAPRRVVPRQAPRTRVRGQVREQDRFRVADERAEQAGVPVGQPPDAVGGLLVDAVVDEVGRAVPDRCRHIARPPAAAAPGCPAAGDRQMAWRA